MAALLPRIKLTYPSKGMIQLIRAYEMDLHGLLMKVMILSPLLLLYIITLTHELREYLRVQIDIVLEFTMNLVRFDVTDKIGSTRYKRG